jgi:hypothetical protein
VLAGILPAPCAPKAEGGRTNVAVAGAHVVSRHPAKRLAFVGGLVLLIVLAATVAWHYPDRLGSRLSRVVVSDADPHELAIRGLSCPRGELIAKPFGVEVLLERVGHSEGVAHRFDSFGSSASNRRA